MSNTRRWIRWSLVGFAGICAAVALLVLLTRLGSHAFGGSSDGATVVLEGLSVRSGNLILHGWTLSLDSFWTTDVLVNAVLILTIGLHPVLLSLVPALIAIAVLVLGAVIALEGRGRAGLAGAAVVVVLLGLPGPTLSYFLLQGAQHVGTALWCLIAFVAARRGRFGWGWLVAVVFLAAGLLGDFQTMALGVVPLFLGGVVAMLRTRRVRGGLAAVSAAGASVVVGLAGHGIAAALGGFTLENANPTAHMSQMAVNLRHLAGRFAGLLGLGTVPVGVSAGPVWLQAAHAVGLVVVLAGVALALVRLIRGAALGTERTDPRGVISWRLDDVLVLALLADLATFVVVSGTGNGHYARYLTPGVLFGVVLAGRAVSEGASVLHGRRSAMIVLVLGLALTGAFAGGVGWTLSSPGSTWTGSALGRYLEEHHLHRGIGDYWSSSIVTVATGGSVAVRPVIEDPQGRLERYDRQSTASWYSGVPFQFLVFSAHRAWRGVDAASAAATFGSPVTDVVVDGYRVLVWSHSLKVSGIGYTRP